MIDELKEVLDRCRRIETRLTRFILDSGFDTQTAAVLFENGTLRVPSPAVSLRDCMDAVPANWEGPIPIVLNQDVIGELEVY